MNKCVSVEDGGVVGGLITSRISIAAYVCALRRMATHCSSVAWPLINDKIEKKDKGRCIRKGT